MKECFLTVYEWRPGGERDSNLNDRYRHCLASCEISRECGANLSIFIGLVKEFGDCIRRLPQVVVDLLGNELLSMKVDLILWSDSFEDSQKDLTANVVGVDLSLLKGATCECACQNYYTP